jgi:hypothetical protein
VRRVGIVGAPSGEDLVQTTQFRVWLKSGARLDWTGVKLVRPPEFIAADVVDVTVEGDGKRSQELY